MSKKIDLCGFSYLAKAIVLKIDEYPKPNYGAEVHHVINTLAADAPMVTVATAHLGLKTALISNSIGADRDGDEIMFYFQKNNVETLFSCSKKIKTPFIIVLSDNLGNREWFPYVPNAICDLQEANINLISQSLITYIDFYEMIRKPAQRAIDFADKNKIPCFVNLGGSPLTPEVLNFLKNKSIAIVQTNLNQTEADNALILAKILFLEIKPEVAIVTLGNKGAVAFGPDGVISVPTHAVKVKNPHGAGAAFSAGYIYCYLQGFDIEKSLNFACALASLSCTVENGFDKFSIQDVEIFLKQS